MDPFGLIFGIATSIFTNIISDMITGTRMTATDEDISAHIEQELERARQQQSLELWKYRQDILSEIRNLAAKDPYIVRMPDRLTLRDSIPVDRDTHLQQLEKIVNARRRELGLPIIEPVPHESSTKTRFEWLAPSTSQEEDVWEKQLLFEMHDRIRRQRDGEVLTDE